MSAYAWLAVCLVVCAFGFGLGLGLGLRIAASRVEATIDRYERITNTPNRRGEAHNWDAEPATVRKGHMLNRRRWGHTGNT